MAKGNSTVIDEETMSRMFEPAIRSSAAWRQILLLSMGVLEMMVSRLGHNLNESTTEPGDTWKREQTCPPFFVAEGCVLFFLYSFSYIDRAGKIINHKEGRLPWPR
ncbi:MAG: hypothetical protein HW389_3316 [Bacteroidetes bacterium]|nr:hypothetical protein [Bacteroidota bacterium]